MRTRSRRALFLSLALLLSAVAGWAQNPGTAEPPKRATSPPYTGDPSIFESPGRDHRLHIDRGVRSESLINVKTILSKPDDPMLPKTAVDAVLLLKTYHEVANPVALLEHLRSALRSGARLGIIDRDGNGTNHGVSQNIVIEEAARAGYKLIGTYDFVKDDGMDYFLLFTVV